MQVHVILAFIGIVAVFVIAGEILDGLWKSLVTRRIDERRQADIALLQHLIQEARKAGVNVVEKNEVG